MNETLIIGRPYIKEANGFSRLCAPVIVPQTGQITLFYEVAQQWGKYFVDERSDSFVLAILKRAMKNAWDISFEAPISEELCYQLEMQGIPILSKNVVAFHDIKLKGAITSDSLQSENKVGTGFSAGVDSFYTVLRHMDAHFPSHNVTHVILARNGAADSSEREARARRWFDATNNKLTRCVEKLGLEYISMWSNIPDFYYEDQFGYGDLLVTGSFIYALRKLFSKYYWASSYDASIFDFKKFDEMNGCGYVESFIAPLISIKELKFYHSGSEASRIEKVAYIADNELVQKSITPCSAENGKNCGKCVKCQRTMAELNAIGKLTKFKESFPVEEYFKHEKWNLAHELAMDHSPFTTDILKTMRLQEKKVGWTIYARKWLIYIPFEFIRKKLGTIYWARKLYYNLNLDGKIGTKHSDEVRKEELDKCKKRKQS